MLQWFDAQLDQKIFDGLYRGCLSKENVDKEYAWRAVSTKGDCS